MTKKNNVKKQKQYSSIQVTSEFKRELMKVKDEKHFDSYENVIKFLIKNGGAK
jgi:hypothetical protein